MLQWANHKTYVSSTVIRNIVFKKDGEQQRRLLCYSQILRILSNFCRIIPIKSNR